MSATLTLPPHLAGRATLRVRDLHDAFGISKPKIHALIRSGRLEAMTLDGCVLIPREAVERYLATARAVEKR